MWSDKPYALIGVRAGTAPGGTSRINFKQTTTPCLQLLLSLFLSFFLSFFPSYIFAFAPPPPPPPPPTILLGRRPQFSRIDIQALPGRRASGGDQVPRSFVALTGHDCW